MRSLKSKIVIIISVSLIVLFGIWNVVWYVVTNNRYHDFLTVVPKSQFGNHILKKMDMYIMLNNRL
ncbi:hypothetical protein SAMN02744102_02161 [Paenibacillus barengoltzii]|jgi:hypothetical protein|nr:hypothetical protein SAMN02744102_02161 [Paenibacillus barengoltzii]